MSGRLLAILVYSLPRRVSTTHPECQGQILGLVHLPLSEGGAASAISQRNQEPVKRPAQASQDCWPVLEPTEWTMTVNQQHTASLHGEASTRTPIISSRFKARAAITRAGASTSRFHEIQRLGTQWPRPVHHTVQCTAQCGRSTVEDDSATQLLT